MWYITCYLCHIITSSLCHNYLEKEKKRNNDLGVPSHNTHRFATSKLTEKQYKKLKSPIKDVNECLSEVTDTFNLIYFTFSPGSRVVNYFPSRITFHSPLSSSDKDLHSHIQRLNQAFCQTQSLLHNVAIITNGGVKKSNMATAITYIWKDNTIISCPQIQIINITPIEAKLMAICIGLIPVMDNNNIHNITIITNSIEDTKKLQSQRSTHSRVLSYH